MIIRYPVSHTWKLYDSDKLSSIFERITGCETVKIGNMPLLKQ